MTYSTAIERIKGKLDCMNKCGVFEREDAKNSNLCDLCDYCYAQGNFGEQRKAFNIAIQVLEKQIEMKKYYDENGCTDCPYRDTSMKDNRCMNDFIIEGKC